MSVHSTVSKFMCSAKLVTLRSLVPAALLVSMMPATLAAQDTTTTTIETHKLVPHSVAQQPNQGETYLASRLESLKAQVSPPTSTMQTPYATAVDRNGNIYVANLAGAVNIYNTSHKLVNTITSGVSAPAAVCIGYNGTIYVANNGNSSITVYSSSLQLTQTITDPALRSPLGMYVDADSNIFVLDTAGTVHMYLDNGLPVGTSSIAGTSAVGPVFNDYGVYAGGNVYFQNSGEAIHYGMFQTGSIAGPISPNVSGATEDPTSSTIYWTDESQSSLTMSVMLTTATTVTMANPGYGIAVDPVRKRLFIAEPLANKVGIYNASTLAYVGSIN